MLKNSESQYGIVTKGFHWLLFLMLTFSVIAGNLLASMPKGTEKLEAAGMHKSFGAVILMLIFARLFWRLINVIPKDIENTPEIQKSLAHAMHWALYALMFAQPLSGILMTQSAGYPISFFGLFDFPIWLDKDKSLAEFFRSAHGVIWIILVVAVLGHVSAALHHHFIKKNGVLKKMIFSTQA
jgi:cytochrome b561